MDSSEINMDVANKSQDSGTDRANHDESSQLNQINNDEIMGEKECMKTSLAGNCGETKGMETGEQEKKGSKPEVLSSKTPYICTEFSKDTLKSPLTRLSVQAVQKEKSEVRNEELDKVKPVGMIKGECETKKSNNDPICVDNKHCINLLENKLQDFYMETDTNNNAKKAEEKETFLFTDESYEADKSLNQLNYSKDKNDEYKIKRETTENNCNDKYTACSYTKNSLQSKDHKLIVNSSNCGGSEDTNRGYSHQNDRDILQFNTHSNQYMLPKLIPITTIGQRMQLPQMTAVVRPITPTLTVSSRNRTRFSSDMVQFLEKHYTENKYPTGETYKNFAQVLGLEWTKVKIWFQNRRSKENRVKKLQGNQTETSNTNTPGETEVVKAIPPRKRRKLNSGKSQTSQVIQNPNYSMNVEMCQQKSVSKNDSERALPTSGEFISYEGSQKNYYDIFNNQKKKALPVALPIPANMGYSKASASVAPVNVNVNNANNIPLYGNRDVLQITQQLGSSQISNANNNAGSYNNNVVNTKVQSAAAALPTVPPGPLHPNMWQPFCFGSATSAAAAPGQVSEMKEVRPSNISTAPGMIFPSVVQPMLIGMPPLYMMNANSTGGTVLDLTKKTPDQTVIHPIFPMRDAENISDVQRAGASTTFGAYWNGNPYNKTNNGIMEASGFSVHNSNVNTDVSQFHKKTHDYKGLNHDMQWRHGCIKNEHPHIPASANCGHNRFASKDTIPESMYTYESGYHMPVESVHKNIMPPFPMPCARTKFDSKVCPQPFMNSVPNPASSRMMACNAQNMQFQHNSAEFFKNLPVQNQPEMPSKHTAKAYGERPLYTTQNVNHPSSTWIGPSNNIYSNTFDTHSHRNEGHLKFDQANYNYIAGSSDHNAWNLNTVEGMKRNLGPNGSLTECSFSRGQSVPTKSSFDLTNSLVDNSKRNIVDEYFNSVSPHQESSYYNTSDSKKIAISPVDSAYSNEKEKTTFINKTGSDAGSPFCIQKIETHKFGLEPVLEEKKSKENTYNTTHPQLDSGIEILENRSHQDDDFCALKLNEVKKPKTPTNVERNNVESSEGVTNRYLPSLAAYSMSDFVNQVSPIFLSRPNTPSPPLCTSTPVKNRSMDGCESEEDHITQEGNDEKSIRELNTPPLHLVKHPAISVPTCDRAKFLREADSLNLQEQSDSNNNLGVSETSKDKDNDFVCL